MTGSCLEWGTRHPAVKFIPRCNDRSSRLHISIYEMIWFDRIFGIMDARKPPAMAVFVLLMMRIA